MERKSLKELGLSIKENYNKTHITMKKIIITLSLMCGIFAFGQEKEVKSSNNFTPTMQTSVKPLVIIDKKESNLQDLHSLDQNLIENITIFDKEKAKTLYGDKGNTGVIVVELKKKNKKNLKKEPLYIVNGQKVSSDILETINPNMIESVNVLKGENAVKQYGEEAREGAIIVTLKKKQ